MRIWTMTLALAAFTTPVEAQVPTKAQLDSVSSYTLAAEDLILREWIRVAQGGGGCDTEVVFKRAWEWGEFGSTDMLERRANLPSGSVHAVTWEAGWDDGDDEEQSGNTSQLDHTWTDIRIIPGYAYGSGQVSLPELSQAGGLPGWWRQTEELIGDLEEVYRETGLGEYPRVLSWRRVFCR